MAEQTNTSHKECHMCAEVFGTPEEKCISSGRAPRGEGLFDYAV